MKKATLTVVFITHGDADGIISAALAARKMNVKYDQFNPIFTQAFLLDRIQLKENRANEEFFYVVTDIGVSNSNPRMTYAFIEQLGNRLYKWYDHHLGWARELINGESFPALSLSKEFVKNRFVINPEAYSCAALIGGDEELIASADAVDSRYPWMPEPDRKIQLIEKAVKANLADDSIKTAAARWLLGDSKQEDILVSKANNYIKILAHTDSLAKRYRKISDNNVAFLDVFSRDFYSYDLTQLLLKGEKMAPFAIVRINHPQSGSRILVATLSKDINLVRLFSLSGGSQSRVSLPAIALRGVLVRLSELKTAKARR